MREQRFAWEALVVAAAVVLYLPTLTLPPHTIDDAFYVYRAAWWSDPSLETLLAALGSRQLSAYTPVPVLSYFLDRLLFGESTFGLHVSHVALFGACVAALLAVGRRLELPRGACLVAGLVFAVHPAQVEVVAWISQRKDLLAGLFSLLAVFVYLGGPRDPAAPLERPRQALVLLFLALALLSKLSALAGVGWVGLAAWRRGRLKRDLAWLVPALLLAAALVVGTYLSLSAKLSGFGVHEPPREATRTFVRALGFYVQRALVPWPLGHLPPRPAPELGAADAAAALALTLLVGAFAWGLLRRRRTWGLWLLACVGPLLPVLQIVPIDVVFVHLRYLFLPLAPLALGVGWALTRRPAARLALAAALVVCAGVTPRYARAWEDPVELASWNLAQAPEDARLLAELARNLEMRNAEGDAERALELYEGLAARDDTTSFDCMGAARIALALGRAEDAYRWTGRIPRRVGQGDPATWWAGPYRRGATLLWLRACMATRRYQEAYTYLRVAPRDSARLAVYRARLELLRERWVEARAHLERARELGFAEEILPPEGPDPRAEWRAECGLLLAVVLRRSDRGQEALAALEPCDPRDPRVQAMRLHLLLDAGQQGAAGELARGLLAEQGERGSLEVEVALARCARALGWADAAQRLGALRARGARALALLRQEGLLE